MKKIAIITGASVGLGKEFVQQIDAFEDIDEIWLCARREQKLKELQSSLKHPTAILAGDVSHSLFQEQLKECLWKQSVQISILVNSAGLGKLGKFSTIGYEDNSYMIDVNIKALTQICSICLPYMAENSRILNVASVAAFLPQANFAVYAASKAYVLSFSRALNQELKERKITVTAVCPNPMETEFFVYAGKKEKTQSIKNLGLEEPEKVASKALKRSIKHKDISVLSFTAQMIRFASRILPHPFVLRIEKLLGL